MKEAEKLLVVCSNYTGINREGHSPKVFASLKNLKVSVTDNRLCVYGSLAQFYHEDGLNLLSPENVKEVTEILSDLSLLDFSTAQISRIDLGSNLYLKEAGREYCKILGPHRLFSRNVLGNSVYYHPTFKKWSLQQAFYDKVDELKWKDYVGPGILRYELRMRLRYLKRHNLPTCLLGWSRHEAMRNGYNFWKKEFQKISLLKRFILNAGIMRETQDNINLMMVLNFLHDHKFPIEKFQSYALAYFDTTLKKKEQRSKKYRYKSKIREIISNYTQDSELSLELKEEVNKYYQEVIGYSK